MAQLVKNQSAMLTTWVQSLGGLGRSPGEGKGYPLQYTGLENSMDCIVHGVPNSHTRLSDFYFHSFNWCIQCILKDYFYGVSKTIEIFFTIYGGSKSLKKFVKVTGCLGLVHWDDPWDGMGREEGGGFRMGNTCIPVADSF